LTAVAKLDQNSPPRESQLIALNRRFHLGVAELTHNSRLAAMEGRVLDDSERVFHIGIGGLTAEQMEAGHLALIDALREHDVDRTVDLSQRESFDTCQRVLEALVQNRDRRTGRHLSVMTEHT
jgi:DNA-binding GntR family transcriptional regulator